MKKISFLLVITIILSMISGCAGTPVVYYTNCTCPVGSHDAAPQPDPIVPADGAVKTGLYISAKLSGSNASDAENGSISYDITLVAVTVDDAGVITSCIIDSLPATVSLDRNGSIVTDLNAAILTKNELGENYGMKKASKIGKEWNEQIDALADYAIGKTVDELKNGAVTESGTPGADLASSASINLGGFVGGIEGAVANAQHLGAHAGDELRFAVIPSLTGSNAEEGKDGKVQLNADVAVITMNGEIITSCYIDSLQASVAFDASGALTTDLEATILTKNQLGTNYGMGAISSIGKEWNEQAAAFARYVTGKTAADVSGIHVSEGKATDSDLASSVTVAIGGFQALIAKAAK